MTPYRSILLLALLAGCAAPGPAADTPQARCARQVEADPQVKAAEERSMTITLIQGNHDTEALHAMKQKKLAACLQLQGITIPGGVEKVQP
jgi:hypothetical protein